MVPNLVVSGGMVISLTCPGQPAPSGCAGALQAPDKPVVSLTSPGQVALGMCPEIFLITHFFLLNFIKTYFSQSLASRKYFHSDALSG